MKNKIFKKSMIYLLTGLMTISTCNPCTAFAAEAEVPDAADAAVIMEYEEPDSEVPEEVEEAFEEEPAKETEWADEAETEDSAYTEDAVETAEEVEEGAEEAEQADSELLTAASASPAMDDEEWLGEDEEGEDDEDDEEGEDDEDDEDGEVDGDEEGDDNTTGSETDQTDSGEEEEQVKAPELITDVSIININTETYSYRAPKYTAKVSNGNVTVLCEEWRCSDGRVNRSAGAYGGSERFRKFEEGKTYYYSITIQANDEDFFSENTRFNINGKYAAGSLSKDKTVFTATAVFYATSACSHEYKQLTQKATCSASGRVYKQCKYCSQEKKIKDLPKTDHEYKEEKTLMRSATCTAAGEKVFICKNCGARKSETIKALGHNYKVDKNKSKAATCTADGYRYKTCSHAGCSAVLKEVVPKTGHKLMLAPFADEEENDDDSGSDDGSIDDEDAGTDSEEDEEDDATGDEDTESGSSFSHLKSKMPTCTEDGYVLHYCTNPGCGLTYKETKKAVGHHNFKKSKTINPATSEALGSYCMICSECGKKSKKQAIPKIANVKLSQTSYTYSGKKNEPKVTVLDQAGKVVDPQYYSVVYLNNVSVGNKMDKKKDKRPTVHLTFSDRYSGTKKAYFTIKKSGQSISTSKSTYTVKKSAVKKKAQTINLGAKAKTALTFKSSDKKHVTVSKKGVVTVKKGAPKKTYTITIQAKGTGNYHAKSKKVKIKVS